MKNLNIDKYKAYRYSFSKLKKAMENEFYFEAILIEYAIFEDRINSLFRRMGFLNQSGNLPESNRKMLKRIFHKNTRWTDISTKIKLIETLITFEAIHLDNLEDKQYLSELYLRIKPLNHEIQQIILQLSPWLKMRNRYVHALMEYKTTNLEIELKEFVTQGETIIRNLDQIVKGFKV
jgi:hypothetical protein